MQISIEGTDLSTAFFMGDAVVPHTYANQQFHLCIGADAELKTCICMPGGDTGSRAQIVLPRQHSRSRAVLWRSNNLADCIKDEAGQPRDLIKLWPSLGLAALSSVPFSSALKEQRGRQHFYRSNYTLGHKQTKEGNLQVLCIRVPIKIILFTSETVHWLSCLICTCSFASFSSFFPH